MSKHLLSNFAAIVIGSIIVAFILAVADSPSRAQSRAAASLSHLLKVSDREYVDLSKVSFIRLPIYTPGCPECQTRWGDMLIVDGGQTNGFSVEAEAKLRELLSAPPADK